MFQNQVNRKEPKVLYLFIYVFITFLKIRKHFLKLFLTYILHRIRYLGPI